MWKVNAHIPRQVPQAAYACVMHTHQAAFIPSFCGLCCHSIHTRAQPLLGMQAIADFCNRSRALLQPHCSPIVGTGRSPEFQQSVQQKTGPAGWALKDVSFGISSVHNPPRQRGHQIQIKKARQLAKMGESLSELAALRTTLGTACTSLVGFCIPPAYDHFKSGTP